MKVALDAKLKKFDACRSLLKDTKRTRLVEANPNDRNWE